MLFSANLVLRSKRRTSRKRSNGVLRTVQTKQIDEGENKSENNRPSHQNTFQKAHGGNPYWVLEWWKRNDKMQYVVWSSTWIFWRTSMVLEEETVCKVSKALSSALAIILSKTSHYLKQNQSHMTAYGKAKLSRSRHHNINILPFFVNRSFFSSVYRRYSSDKQNTGTLLFLN